jgi:hypothetical protein
MENYTLWDNCNHARNNGMLYEINVLGTSDYGDSSNDLSSFNFESKLIQIQHQVSCKATLVLGVVVFLERQVNMK